MRRREFIAGLGSAAALPLVARAQQQAIPAIGFLNVGSARQNARYVAEFLQNLGKAGYVEGKNAVIEYRWGDGQLARLAELGQPSVGRDRCCRCSLNPSSQGRQHDDSNRLFVSGQPGEGWVCRQPQ